MGFNGIRVLMPFIQVPNNGWLTQSLKFRSLQGPKAHATESDPPKACKLSSAPSHCTTFASHVLVHIVLAEAGVIERQWNFRTNLTSVVCVCLKKRDSYAINVRLAIDSAVTWPQRYWTDWEEMRIGQICLHTPAAWWFYTTCLSPLKNLFICD